MDALSAAITRWKRLVFTDFTFGRLLKIGCITMLAEFSGGGSSGNFNFSRQQAALRRLPPLPHAVRADLFLAFAVAAAIGLVVGIVLLYLSCRAKFTEFHMAASGSTLVAPPWRLYARQTWWLFWTTLVVHLVALAVLAAIAAPFFLAMKHRGAMSGALSFRQLLAMLLVLLPIFFAWALVVQFAQMIVRDFMLPAWALEDAGVGQAWQVARRVMESDAKAFFGYTLLKIGMHIAVSIAALLVFAATLLVSAIPFGGAGMAVFLALRHAASPAKILMVLLFIMLGGVALVWLFVLVFAIFGGAQFLFQCYAVEWFAGRYPPLAALMTPGLPPTPASPAMQPSHRPLGGGYAGA